MDLRRQLSTMRAWIPLVVACVVLAGAAAFIGSSLLPKTYEARARLIVGQSLAAANPDYNQLLVSQRLSTTYATIATTRPILEAVIAELGLDVTADELGKHVRADAPLDSTILTITVDDEDADQAAAIANALGRQMISASPALQGRAAEFQTFVDQELTATRSQIETSQARVEALLAVTDRTAAEDAELAAQQSQLVSLRSTYATLLSYASGSAASLLTMVEPAVAPAAPVSPRPLFNMVLAAMLGLLVAVGIAFLAERLNDTMRDTDAVSEATGLSTLGTISRMRTDRDRSEIYHLATLLYPRSDTAEAYRALRTNVEFASVDAPVQTLLVTSAGAAEGKTVTAANLAVVFAQGGRRVLLVDADLRKPGIHQLFSLDNQQGLTTLLRSDEPALDALTQATEQPDLRILATGPLPPNPAELLGSQRMRTTLERLRGSADLIILDSPPLQAVTDAAILSSLVDGTLLVIDAGRSHRRTVRPALEALERAGARVLGAVLNRVPGPAHRYGIYYGESFAAGTSSERAGTAASASSESTSPAAGLRQSG